MGIQNWEKHFWNQRLLTLHLYWHRKVSSPIDLQYIHCCQMLPKVHFAELINSNIPLYGWKCLCGSSHMLAGAWPRLCITKQPGIRLHLQWLGGEICFYHLVLSLLSLCAELEVNDYREWQYKNCSHGLLKYICDYFQTKDDTGKLN